MIAAVLLARAESSLAAHQDSLITVEPTVEDLEAIEAEWPVLAAELAVVDAHCRFLNSPDVLARRALRRAVVAHTNATRTVPHPHRALQGTRP